MPGIDDLDPDRDRIEVALALPTGSASMKGAPGFWNEMPNPAVFLDDVVGADFRAGIAEPPQCRFRARHAGIVKHQHVDARRVISGAVIGRGAFVDPKRDHSDRSALCELFDLFIGGVDARDPGSRQRDTFGRQPLRDHEIGMTLAHQTMIGLADRAGGGAGQNPEDRVRVLPPLRLGADMESPDAGVIRCLETEIPSHFAQILVFGGKDASICESNMEQAAEQVLEHGSIGREQTADLAGIALEPGSALAGEVKHQPDMLLFARRNLKNLAKSRDFIAGDDAVGPRHLGAERDHRDRKGDVPAWIVVSAFGVPAWDMARRACKQCTERTAERQFAGAGYDAANKAHIVRGSRCERVNGCRSDPFGGLSHPPSTYGTIRR